MERQESVNSNNSKDSKQSKKQQKKIIAEQQQQQQQQQQLNHNVHSFPLHPQYPQHPGSSQTTVYKPADYVNANKKSSQHFSTTSVAASQNQASSAHSIMDQLNRGVKVEGLRLPPGITLTKVTPSNAEIHHQKRESINRVSYFAQFFKR
jgi:hypothetical protein